MAPPFENAADSFRLDLLCAEAWPNLEHPAFFFLVIYPLVMTNIAMV